MKDSKDFLSVMRVVYDKGDARRVREELIDPKLCEKWDEADRRFEDEQYKEMYARALRESAGGSLVEHRLVSVTDACQAAGLPNLKTKRDNER